MTAINYTAKRNISGGHSASTAYDLETLGEELTPALNPNINQTTTLDGTVETLFNHLEESWKVKTSIIDQADYDVWYEFLSSVAGGELFTFDAYGTIAVPDNIQNVIMIGAPTLARVTTLTKWNISFTVKVQ